MLIIHPKDRTTAFLSAIYNGADNAVVITENISRADLNHRLHHTPKSERILLLGHGSDKGLCWREDDSRPNFDGIALGHPHSYHLRNQAGTISRLSVDIRNHPMLDHLYSPFDQIQQAR